MPLILWRSVIFTMLFYCRWYLRTQHTQKGSMLVFTISPNICEDHFNYLRDWNFNSNCAIIKEILCGPEGDISCYKLIHELCVCKICGKLCPIIHHFVKDIFCYKVMFLSRNTAFQIGQMLLKYYTRVCIYLLLRKQVWVDSVEKQVWKI